MLLKTALKDFSFSKICTYRFLQTFPPLRTTEMSALAVLRKKTGYTFANCKKALELHDNDVTKAEIWLREQAQALGWTKATKLEGRPTPQGLIAISCLDNVAAMVEVNCETDFVAKNDLFKNLAEETVNVCYKYAQEQPNQHFLKIELMSDQLRNLTTSEGTRLADKLALFIGSVGESASFRRAICFKASKDLSLYAYTHPSGNMMNDTLLGRIGALVALNYEDEIFAQSENADSLGRSLCQHIVGMNPQKIGDIEEDRLVNVEEEDSLVHQEFLNDPGVTVGEILEAHNAEVVYFKRFECGEDVNRDLDCLESCQ